MSSDGPPATIVVYGATGFTGGLVCEELIDRGRDVVAAGRNFEKLQRLSTRLGETRDAVATLRQGGVDDPDSLDRMLDGADVLINCAGPFTDVGRPVVEAAVRNGVHYLDTTGEQGFIKRVRNACGERASERGTVLMPACAFEYATGVMAGRLAMEQGETSIGVSYGVRNMRPSTGTQRSILRALAEPGVAWVDGRLVTRRPAARTHVFPTKGEMPSHGVWFPGGEALFLPQLDDALERVESYLTVGPRAARWLAAVSDYLPSLVRWSEPLVDRAIQWWSRYNDPGGRAEFEVLAFDLDTSERLAAARGVGPYPTTARIIVETATRLVDAPEGIEPGFQSVASLFDVREFARSVGVELETYR